MITVMMSFVIVGLAGLVKLREKRDLNVSWGMFIAALVLYEKLLKKITDSVQNGFSFLWNQTQIGAITIDFYPDTNDISFLTSLFTVSMLIVLYNNMFREEERKSRNNAIILLNFVSMCLLIGSENYIQLITAVFVIDILGYLLLKDVDVSHSYVIYNFVADILLFMIMALSCGKLQSLELEYLTKYQEISRHKDFVGVVTALILTLKTGSFMFHGYLLDLSKTGFQRLVAIELLFSPLAGIVLLLKMHELLEISPVGKITLLSVCWLSLTVGMLNFILLDSIKKKIIYLDMCFYSSLIPLLINGEFVWRKIFSEYYLIAGVINFTMLQLFFYQNNEEFISKMLNVLKIKKRRLKMIIIQLVLVMNIFFSVMCKIKEETGTDWLLGLAVILSCGVAVMANHLCHSPYIFAGNKQKNEPSVYLFSALWACFIGFGTWFWQAYSLYNMLFIMFSIGIIVLSGINKFRKVYEINIIQNNEISRKFFFYIVVNPVVYLSRILWLTGDFVLSEKIVTAGVSGMNHLGISAFFKINRKGYLAGLVFAVLGILVFIAAFYGVNWR